VSPIAGSEAFATVPVSDIRDALRVAGLGVNPDHDACEVREIAIVERAAEPVLQEDVMLFAGLSDQVSAVRGDGG